MALFVPCGGGGGAAFFGGLKKGSLLSHRCQSGLELLLSSLQDPLVFLCRGCGSVALFKMLSAIIVVIKE